MFDEICSEMRDLIHDVIDDSLINSNLGDLISERGVEGVCIQVTDDGLAISIGNDLYSISIQKV